MFSSGGGLGAAEFRISRATTDMQVRGVCLLCINSAISWWYGVTSVRRYRERRAAGCKTKIIARNNHFV